MTLKPIAFTFLGLLAFAACSVDKADGASLAQQVCACYGGANTDVAKMTQCLSMQTEQQRKLQSNLGEMTKFLQTIAQCTTLGSKSKPPSQIKNNAVPSEQPGSQGEYDSIGSTKEWSHLSATLKDVSGSRKTGKVALLLKNDGDEEESISSLLYFGATNQEGEKGSLDIFEGTSCDGAVPPKGILKCKLAFKFESAPEEMTIRIGLGVTTKTTYFKVKLRK